MTAMKNDENIEERIEEVLNSIGNIQRATPKPYLLTRINARLAPAKNAWENLAAFISKPSNMAAGICLLLAINISVLAYKNQIPNATTERSITISADEEDDYNNLATIDNIENPQ
jgi:hypothetical protein